MSRRTGSAVAQLRIDARLLALNLSLSTSSVLVPAPLHAQQIDPVDVYEDPHGIDLLRNTVSTPKMPELSIPAAPELSFRDLSDFVPLLEVATGDTQTTGYDANRYWVSAGRNGSDVFAACGEEECFASNGTGSMLYNAEGFEGATNVQYSCSPAGWGCPSEPPGSFPGDTVGTRSITFRAGNSGLMVTFDVETDYSSGTMPSQTRRFLARQIDLTNGGNLQIDYDSANIGGTFRHRPAVATSSSGYQIHFTYFSENDDINWGMLHKAELVEAVNPQVILASHTYSANSVTDLAGRVYLCACQPSIYPVRPEQRGSRMRLPGAPVDVFTTSRPSNGNVRTVESEGVTYTYTSTPDNSWMQPPGSPWPVMAIHDLTITGPHGFRTFIDVTNLPASTGRYDPPRSRIESVTDANGRTTRYEYNGSQQLRKIIYPEGNSVEFTRDIRGNITSRTDRPKASSTLPQITQSAQFPVSQCGIIGFNCYRPDFIVDSNGNRTDYSWDLNGLLLTSLEPADESGKRKKTINTWSGTESIGGEACPSFIQYGLPGGPRCTSRLVREEICETDVNGTELTCGTADSYVRTFTYFRATSLIASETRTNGMGDTPLTTTFEYDDAGRQIAHTPPAGT